MSAVSMPVEVYCSYAPEDEAWLHKLETHLSLLKRQGLISLWHNRLIGPGTDWALAIDTHMETASVILLLVSADFFASNYCFGIEMKHALARQQAGEARVIPILVRAADWKDAPFAHLQALPTDSQPLTTWQDEDTALADVAAGIRRVLGELPLLAASVPRAALPAIWNIPYSRNPFFLGRENELAQLRHHLQAGQATALSQPQAITGLGGVGKTQLALEYAYRYHKDYQAVLWTRAESTEALVSSYVAIATLLQLPEREAQEQDITVQAVKTWLQTHRGWLLILDNADELTLLSDFLPPTVGGHLLLTTRAAATGRLAYRMEIETLALEQSALFLLRRAGFLAPDAALEQAYSQQRELALQICHELGCLPLALDQAGAYLEETGIDLAGYWHIYQQHRTDLLHKRGGLVADHPEPVATTWSLSFRKVEEKQPAAAELLQFCAYLAPDALPEEILIAGASFLGPPLGPVAADAFQLSQAIEALRAYSLMRRDPREKVLSMHRLVQAVLKDELEEAERCRWAECAVLAVNAAFPKSEYATWPQCERLLPHALIATQLIETYHISRPESGRLLSETASYLQDRTRYHEAEPLYQRALLIREQALGPDHPEMAYSLTGLAILYWQQGKYEQAEPLYQRALLIREQALGPDHPEMAYSLTGLAILYQDQGKYEQAESLYQRALRIGEQILGPDHPQMAYLLTGLAKLYWQQGKYEQAESLYQRALRIREQALGPDHPQVAYSLIGLAELYRQQGKYEQAESLYQRALRIGEQILGPDHPQVAYSLIGLAKLYQDQSMYYQAESLYQRALRIRIQRLGSQHPDTIEIMDDLALFQEILGNRVEALSLYEQGLVVHQQTLGDNHPKTRETRKRYTALLRSMGRYDEAALLEVSHNE